MIADETFLKKIRSAFNLNIYEAKIWLALLMKGVATAGELADISGVPRSRSYDVLESLEKRGFIVMKLGKPIKYMALKPEEVFAREKRKIMENAEAKIKALSNIEKTDLFKELQTLYNRGVQHISPEAISGSLRGQNMYDHLISLINEAKRSIHIATTATGLIKKYERLGNALKRAAKRGVTIRIAAPITKENKPIADSLSKIAKIKNTNPNSRFLIIDNSHVVTMVTDDKVTHDNYDTAIWVKSPYFANSLNTIFSTLWK